MMPWMVLTERLPFGEWVSVPDAPITIDEAIALDLPLDQRQHPTTRRLQVVAMIPARGVSLTMPDERRRA